MTKEETKTILSKVKMVYPSSFTNMTYNDGIEMLNTWYDYLKDYDLKTIENNLNEHIETSKFVPRISELTKKKKIAGSTFANYEQNEKCTKEEWDNMVDLYNRYFNKPMKVGKLVDEYLGG